MKAIQFRVMAPRPVVGAAREVESALAKFYPGILWSGVSCGHAEVPEPRLPGEDWVKIKTRYGGICGSDLGGIHLYCRDTGGSWGACFTAHESQLYRVPNNVGDENAVLVEPFGVALHAVLQDIPGDDEPVLVIGAGAVGLLTIAALRALGSHARVLVLARCPFRAEAALKLGATEIIPSGRGRDYYAESAER
jgi:threonine dehydrogenase-like Zn-dependent dehydrogenase